MCLLSVTYVRTYLEVTQLLGTERGTPHVVRLTVGKSQR